MPTMRNLSTPSTLLALSLLSVEPVQVASAKASLSSSILNNYPHPRLLQLFEDEATTEQFAPRSTTASSFIGKPLDDSTLREAVHEWVTSSDKTLAAQKYGPIETWDVSRVTDMSKLFTNARFFHEDLNQWNTSSVTDMSYVFAFCSSFDSDLGNWDVSRVTDLSFAFHHATRFEGRGLVHWDVSHVMDLTYFAQGASGFKEKLWRWHTQNVKSYSRAFHNATAFDAQLCWELHPQAVAVQAFCGTSGATFSCDPNHALQSTLNKKYYNCCDCAYTAHNPHPVEYTPPSTDDSGDQKLGVWLASSIWAMVFIMLVAVIGLTLLRRREVRQWLHAKLNGPEGLVAPDGGAIATFVGPAGTTSSSSPPPQQQSPNANATTSPVDTDIPMVVAGISTPHTTTSTPPNSSGEGPAWAQASYPASVPQSPPERRFDFA